MMAPDGPLYLSSEGIHVPQNQRHQVHQLAGGPCLIHTVIQMLFSGKES